MSAAVSVFVAMTTAAFAPSHVDVLAGDNVVWRNNSLRTHNVKFESAGFTLGRIAPRGGANHRFEAPGVYPYICTIHDGMNGEVGVYPVLLEGPRRRLVRRGASLAFQVRAPEGAGEVTIEADSGHGFVPVAAATPEIGDGHEGHDAPGALHATVVASETAVYRAVFEGGSSNALRIEVTDTPEVLAAVKRGARGGVVDVRAVPGTPGARVVLELKLRERFGWWPVARGRLDGRSHVRFRLPRKRGVPARVVLVGPDWATPLAASRVVKLPD